MYFVLIRGNRALYHVLFAFIVLDSPYRPIVRSGTAVRMHPRFNGDASVFGHTDMALTDFVGVVLDDGYRILLVISLVVYRLMTASCKQQCYYQQSSDFHIIYNCLPTFSIASCSMTSNSEKFLTLLNLTRGFPFRSTKPYKVSSSSSVMP